MKLNMPTCRNLFIYGSGYLIPNKGEIYQQFIRIELLMRSFDEKCHDILRNLGVIKISLKYTSLAAECKTVNKYKIKYITRFCIEINLNYFIILFYCNREILFKEREQNCKCSKHLRLNCSKNSI